MNERGRRTREREERKYEEPKWIGESKKKKKMKEREIWQKERPNGRKYQFEKKKEADNWVFWLSHFQSKTHKEWKEEEELRKEGKNVWRRKINYENEKK